MKHHATALAAAACLALLGTAAHARTLQQQLTHHAAEQTRIAAAEARGRLALPQLAALQNQAAVVERVEAATLRGHDTVASRRQLAYAERDLDRMIARAERIGTRSAALDRLHAQVASAREAQQQRWIARGFRDERIGAQQVASLEAAQGAIARREATLERRGHESVAQALQMQHRQDVQDWAIRTGQALG